MGRFGATAAACAAGGRGLACGWRKVLVPVLFLAALLLPQGLAAGQALANPDWVVNIDDDGYDPTPLNGTVVYRVRVTNEDLRACPESS